ncbi:hypothetical protein [Sinosporangium siamense]|uniref:Uncharacterized protein n=1 Tax=Sinosporangium siamense TaxID=1367973 RepID=A0A919V3M3_9ACTN|nr:hypothetical protein [Sinosporangium siamense]GII91095.1 hypothetical protein Ssi02_13260 [Sinosporangium siamense]
MRNRVWHVVWPYAVGGLLGVLALGPALAPGFTLAYDMVFVPEPVFLPSTFGLTGTLPRAVPSDAAVALLGTVLPGALVQKLILLSLFLIACGGAAALLDGRPAVVRLAAAVFYAWNPFVAERLLLGQWALLLGYAGLPWAVRAALDPRGLRWVWAFVPAAAGGFMAMIITALTVLPVAALGPGGRRALARVSLACVVFALPWLVPSLVRQAQVPSDAAGVAAFAARADTPLGGLGSLFTLSGVWNAEVVPPGLDPVLPSVLRLLVAVAAVAAFAVARPGGMHLPARAGLAVASAAGLVIASAGLTGPGRAVLVWLIDLWPGFAVVRDAQQYVAPLALLTALGVGGLAGLLAGSSRRARVPAGVLGVAAPLLLLPGLVWGAWGRLAAVDYPRDFERVREIVAADREQGDVLLLPWESYRAYAWNGGRSSLDPLPRYLTRHVVWNDAVRVASQAGDLVIGTEDPRARALDSLIRSAAPLAGPLRAAGFRFVVLDGDPREWNRFQSRLAGAAKVYSGPHAALYALSWKDAQVSRAP